MKATIDSRPSDVSLNIWLCETNQNPFKVTDYITAALTHNIIARLCGR